jgi:hypothetical protein
MNSTIRREDAAFQELVASYWRDWRTFLRAHATLLATRDQHEEGSIEHAPTTARALAERNLVSIPSDRRLLFERHLEQRREDLISEREAILRAEARGAPIAPLDPDEISHAAIESLIAEAEGRNDGSGWGIAILPDGPYRVRVADLLGQPSDAHYQLNRADPQSERRRALIGVAALSIGLLITCIWWLNGNTTLPFATQATTIEANGQPLTPWSVRGVILSTTAQTYRLPVRDLYEPHARSSTHAGYQAGLPPMICLPSAIARDLAHASTITLTGSIGIPDRRYQIRPYEGGSYDLILRDCADQATITHAAILNDAAAPPTYAIGQTANLQSGGQLTITAISAEPQQQSLRIVVNYRTSSPFDWSAATPTLLLRDGTRALPSAITDRQLTYLLPSNSLADTVVLAILPPAELQTLRWRSTLSAEPRQ